MRSHINLATIETIATELLQGPSETLLVDKLPGCQQNAPVPEA
jgi:hypothetical protein